MRSSITQFTIRVIDSVAAYSAVERAWMMAQDTVTKPFQSPAPKAEFRLSDHQQLRKIFLSR